MPSVDSGRREDSLAAVEKIFATCRRAVLNKLGSHLGDHQLAEEAVQDAFETAITAWSDDGVPDKPEAWIVVTARRKAIDRLRRARTLDDRVRRLAAELDEPGEWSGPEGAAVADDHLRLLFTCCHPALSMGSRVALTLRVICGLTTSEIAASLLTTETTMAQRISRAKRKIRDANVPYRVPAADDLPPRLDAALATVYLVFNEGYSNRRDDLSWEALRLARLLVNLVPNESEAHALLALMCFQQSRAGARTRRGRFVPLDEQDRDLWDRDLIDQGVQALRRARAAGPPGSYQIQAAIAAVHADVAGKGRTDWPLVVSLHELLAQVHRSPVGEVNHATALGRAGRPRDGLDLLSPYLSDPQLENYQPLHVAHATLLAQLGDPRAIEAYDLALAHTTDPVEADELRGCRDSLDGA